MYGITYDVKLAQRYSIRLVIRGCGFESHIGRWLFSLYLYLV